MFEIETIKVFKREVCFLNDEYDHCRIIDYVLQIGNSYYPCSEWSDDWTNVDLKDYDVLISTSSFPVFFSWLVKFSEKEEAPAANRMYEYFYHYFYGLFRNFFREVLDMMELDIHELEKL